MGDHRPDFTLPLGKREREAAVEAYQALPLVKRKDVPAQVTAPEVAVVGVDGGRLQILERQGAKIDAEQAADAEDGRSGKHWREDKIGLLMTMQSAEAASDPCPEIPEPFVDPTRILKLARELKKQPLPPGAEAVKETAEPEVGVETLAENRDTPEQEFVKELPDHFADDLGDVFGRVLALSMTLAHPAFEKATSGFANDGRVYLVYPDSEATPLSRRRGGLGTWGRPSNLFPLDQVGKEITDHETRAASFDFLSRMDDRQTGIPDPCSVGSAGGAFRIAGPGCRRQRHPSGAGECARAERLGQ